MSDLLPTELQLNIVSPDRLLVRDSVTAVTVPGKDGYIGVLPGHAPLLTELVPGELTYTREGVRHYLSVNWGFAEVLPDRVIVLVQSAERAEEIDIERAQRAKARAEERLKRFLDPEIDMQRAREALRRALARLETARHSQIVD
jgi:F-type H+-transporting ATPase subunit epsilon